MANVLANITSVFTASMGWVGSVGEMVVDNPLLFVGAVVSFAGLAIGLFKRLLHI